MSVWIQRDGTRISPEDMTAEHRQAVIDMVMLRAKHRAQLDADKYWSHTGNTDVTLSAMEMESLASDDAHLFNEMIRQMPVIKRMAELNALIKGENE